MDVAFYDLSSGKETVLARPGIQTAPSVWRRNITWQNNGTEIVLYNVDTGEERTLIRGPIVMEPAIGERGVVWTDYRQGLQDPDIYI